MGTGGRHDEGRKGWSPEPMVVRAAEALRMGGGMMGSAYVSRVDSSQSKKGERLLCAEMEPCQRAKRKGVEGQKN